MTIQTAPARNPVAAHITAREAALNAALEVFRAERQLDGKETAVATLSASWDTFVLACDEAARTARELPLARQPKGLRS